MTGNRRNPAQRQGTLSGVPMPLGLPAASIWLIRRPSLQKQKKARVRQGQSLQVRLITTRCERAGSEGVAVGFTGADAEGVVDRGDEDLAVADLPGACAGGDDIDRLVRQGAVDRNLQPQLGQ